METNKKKGKLIIISSPSGGGKTTICNKLRELIPEIIFSVSTTSRPMRGNEKNGREYYFVSREHFEKMIKQDFFLEWAIVHGNYYGTSKRTVEKLLKENKTIILDIDVQGGIQIKKKYPDALSIFIMPPSLEKLEKRLRGRATDSEESIQKRLKDAIKEMEYKELYDYTAVNDEIDDTVNKILEIII